MAQTSRVLPVVRKLSTLFLAARPDPDRQAVIVGARPETDDEITQRVYVGWSGDLGDLTMARFDRADRGAGNRRQTERFDVNCAVVCWTGDDDTADMDDDGISDSFADLLVQVETLFAAVDAAVRANRGAGQLGPAAATVTAGAIVPDVSGLLVRLPFVVNFATQI